MLILKKRQAASQITKIAIVNSQGDELLCGVGAHVWRTSAILCAQLVHDVGEALVVGQMSRSRGRGKSTCLRQHDVPGPRAHDIDVVGKERRLAQIVRHQDDGEAQLLPEIAQHAPQFFARERIERGERLVEHQQRRLVDQRAAERDALLHAAGQLPRIAVAEALQADGCKQLLGLRAKLGLSCAKLRAMRLHDFERQQHVVDDFAPRQQVRVLERHAGDLHRPLHLVARRSQLSPAVG